ncbi:MAG: ferritin-like domain-containing protein [Candidatus Binatia bacterium]
MAPNSRSRSIKAIASQKAEDPMWGIAESPEFSAVQHLMNEFKSQESDEAKWLKTYQEIADKAEDPLVRFLLSLIIADEERHHQIIDRMISRLKNDLAWTRSEGIRQRKSASAAKNAGLRGILERFVAVERSGIKEYERLSRASGGLGHDLFGLLCRTMVYDSEKHIGILEFLQRRLREPKKTATKQRT